MKHIALNTLIAATVCLTAPAMAKTQQLTESMVKQFIDESKTFVDKQDIDGFANYLSDDAKITMNINMGGQKTSLTVNKNDYLNQTKESFKIASDYSYDMTLNGIKIDGDKAYVDATVIENITVSGMPMVSTTKEKAVVQLRNNQLKIVNIVGDMSMQLTQ